jgi:hypothetical protein
LSKFTIRIDYNSSLWTEWPEGKIPKFYNHKIEGSEVQINFGGQGINISDDFEISEVEQFALAKCLLKVKVGFVPLWHDLSPDTHRLVKRIEDSLLATVRRVDLGFRMLEKGIRLPPPKIIRRGPPNSQQLFAVFTWAISLNEIEVLLEREPISADVRSRIEKSGLLVPCSPPFGQKHLQLGDREVSEVFANIDKTKDSPPYWLLYGIALENFIENRSFGSAVLILATAIETALKGALIEKGDEIARFLLDKVQSPPLRELFKCFCNAYEVTFPERFSGWIDQINYARNFAAHKPRELKIEYLQMARWFAVGEAVLRSVAGKEIDGNVGQLVKPIGDRASEKFASDAKGVVLRNERFHGDGEMKFHILMDTGETYYFTESGFEILPKDEQKFPDPK